jgi:predicted MFS family arabinose efflux permease
MFTVIVHMDPVLLESKEAVANTPCQDIPDISLIGSKALGPGNGDYSAPFSTFTRKQKRWIVFLIAFAAMFSPLSSFIYYPAINSIAKSLRVSTESVNLTVTSYMVVSGIVPALLGNFADMIGRRLAYLIALSVYLLANLELALQRSFPALLTIRMLQSAGSSGIICFCID